jgi:hypothetical protein
METLDSDKAKLTSSKGIQAKRDIVQFVKFNDFKGNLNVFTSQVLGELPKQVVQYKQMVGQAPNPPPKVEITQYGMDQMNMQAPTQQGFVGQMQQNLSQNQQWAQNQQQQQGQ